MGLRELYKGIQRKPTREETYLIKGLLVDAGKAEHNAAFVKLGLKPMLDQLKAINEDYEKKTASRAASQVANTLIPAKELRKQLDQYYEAFMMKIGALAIGSCTLLSSGSGPKKVGERTRMATQKVKPKQRNKCFASKPL